MIGGHTHTRSQPWGGFTLVCAHSGGGEGSRAPQPWHGAAWGKCGSCPGTPAGMVDGGVALPLALRHGCFPQRSPRNCWGSGQRCLGTRGLCCICSSVLPALPASSCTPGCWGGERGPLLLCPCIELLSCQGLSQTTSPTFLTLELLWEQVGSLQLLPSCLAERASDFQAMADLRLSELANKHGENELFRLT